MRQFKKRTIALVLASVVTVVGSFGANNYKNSLMSLDFESDTSGAVNMIVETKTAYDGNITPIRKDANTYILMLPEINSEASTPDLQKVSGNIESVNIRTMPYSSNGNGYTKVTVKTYNSVNLSATNKIYIASEAPATKAISQKQELYTDIEREKAERNKNLTENKTNTIKTPSINSERTNNTKVQEETSAEEENTIEEGISETGNANQASDDDAPVTVELPSLNSEPAMPDKNSYEAFLLVLGIFFILIVSAFIYVKGKNKLREIAGEEIVIDDKEQDENGQKKKEEKKLKKIKNTIKKLDSTYAKSAAVAGISEYTPSVSEPVKTVRPSEELNIIDLDELFQEQAKSKNSDAASTEAEENSALEEFLNGFSFDDIDESGESEEENTQGYDEQYYNTTVNSDNLHFTKNDIHCINQLLSTEINDNTLKNIKEYAISQPVITQPSKQKILENFVTDYTISQNITFTQDDINALKKLINVEIDADFITDLRTNPERTKEIEKELQTFEKPRKPSEILTLNVKDMLPDLSEALRKQGGRKIESEVKPITVYYSEGYEVNTLSLNDDLPDLSLEINNRDAYTSRPSADIEYTDSNYEVQKLNISNELPDLNDVLKNPEKYEEPEQEEYIPDEEALLKNISNVQFKPFYDGSESFEILNDFEDMNTPTVSDIQKEFSQFENFEISNEEYFDNTSVENEYDDFESLYNNEFVDLDSQEIKEEKEPEKETIQEEAAIKEEKEEEEKISETESKIIKEEPSNVRAVSRTNTSSSRKERAQSSKDLIRKIEEIKAERLNKAAQRRKELKTPVIKEKSSNKPAEIKCILDGETFNVISSAVLIDNKGCHLAKNENGYTVLGYVGDKIFKLKHYDLLKSEKIQARINEKVSDDITRYIVRIGLNKFIVNLTNDNIEYVMDLC